MWRRSLQIDRKVFSLDHLMGGSVMLATVYMLYEAYSEGNLPLTKHMADHEAQCPRLCLTVAQCRTLETTGYLVMDDFLTPEELSRAATAARNIPRDGTKSVVFTGIREASLAYFDASYVGGTETVPDAQPYDDAALLDVRRLLRGVAYSVRTSAFGGFVSGNAPRQLGVPDTLQLSLYRANHPVSNYNAAHRDGSSNDTIWQTGVLGHLRSKHLRQRYLTCILYLNDKHAWDTAVDGGQLRIYHQQGNFADIEPRGGRLVLLDSVSILHAVLPSQRDRIACSIWFTRQ